MTPAGLQTIEEIFHAALDQEPDQVSAFLDTACEGDAVLRREVEALLTSDQRAGRFIERSAVGLVTKIIQNGQADSLVGQTIGHYKISEPIGTGGMGEAVDVAIQVASALAAAHHAGIVHRDIKPENIMRRPDGYVKVLDFGIAKLAEQEVPITMPRDEALLLVETNLGSILGTVRYMSPEQACGGHVDKRTDIWSLGVVLYEMVSGHAPFTGDTPREVMSAILEKEPPPLTRYFAHAPAELQQIISKTLRKDRTGR